MSDEWWRNAVIYQVYPRSFQDSNGDGIGDLPGITRRLDHIASLGVDAIWLSPFFRSPMNDMGYDISDQRDVDPLFGTLDDFDTFLAEAHERGLKVIIDQVPGHTSDEHPWFIESKESRTSDKADWYVWADANPDGTPPNNWLSVFGGPAWTWGSRRKQYYLHNFLATQPQMNFHNPEVREQVLSDMRFWLDRGVDGFRLDSINYPYHDAELRDNPPKPKEELKEDDWVNPYNVQDHIYSKTRPELPQFLERVRALTEEYSDRFTVGEVGESGLKSIEIMGEYTAADRLHMAYSFALLSHDFSAEHFRDCVGGFFAHAGGGWPCWAFSNHDVVRHVSRWTGDPAEEDPVARLSIALLVSFEGAKCLYQGEELGQSETELDYDELTDPPGIRMWPEYKGRDGCRTPMVWEAEAPHAGFTTGTPWLPVKAPQAAHAVDRMEEEAGSILHHYRSVLSFHRENEALRSRGTHWLDVPEPLLAFVRGRGEEALTCVFNLSGDPIRLEVGDKAQSTGPGSVEPIRGRLTLGAHRYAWLFGADGVSLSE